MTNYKQPAAQADHTENHLEMAGRWYMVNKMGMATLCTDKDGAEKEAADAQRFWPHMGPHRAVQLVEAADVEALRAGYAAARLEIESLRARSVAHAGEYPALPEIKDMHNGPQQLNLSDRAMWVLGWNECRDAARDADRAMRAAQQESFDHGPQATSIEEAARDVGKWLNERPNRPLDLRHVAMLCAQPAPQQEAPAMHSGWVSCTIEFDGSGPEEVAYGPKIMMDRLAKWLGKHFERTIAEKAAPQPLPASQGDALDAARLDWLLLHISGAEFRRIGVHYSGNARRADVDAARKQGANHD